MKTCASCRLRRTCHYRMVAIEALQVNHSTLCSPQFAAIMSNVDFVDWQGTGADPKWLHPVTSAYAEAIQRELGEPCVEYEEDCDNVQTDHETSA